MKHKVFPTHPDYVFRTVLSAALSLSFTVLFALYNGYLGLALASVWHGSICIFYLLLTAIRGIILLAGRGSGKRTGSRLALRRRRVYLLCCAILLLLDLALVVPVSMMTLQKTPVNMGLIPGIAMAAYTTWKVAAASVHLRLQARRSEGNMLIPELRAISFIDALVSVLTLQNTLIMINRSDSDPGRMMVLTAVTSAVIYAAILLMSVLLLIRGLRENRPHPYSPETIS